MHQCFKDMAGDMVYQSPLGYGTPHPGLVQVLLSMSENLSSKRHKFKCSK